MSSFPYSSGSLGLSIDISSSGVKGNVFDALRISGGSIQIKTVGTAEGSFQLQGSNVIIGSGSIPWSTDPADWITVDTSAVTAGGSCLLNIENFGFRFLRMNFLNTNGSGVANLYFCFKGH